ncbi:hypothetical protein FPV67DRAFT_1480845, partial [Lyophyllum atratum]
MRDTVLAFDARLGQFGYGLDDANHRLDRISDAFDPTVPDSPPLPSNKRQRTSTGTMARVHGQPSLPPIAFTPQPAAAPFYPVTGPVHPPPAAAAPSWGHTHQRGAPAPAPPAPAVSVAPPTSSLGPPAPAVPGPPHSSSTNLFVEVGSVSWGKNITGEFKALLQLVPKLGHISRQIRAHRARPGYLKVQFNSNIDAASFIAIWSAGPRPAGYENVTAQAL